MNVSDVLLLPSFAGAQVIAGHTGLTNEVSTAMVVEAPDIDVWGKPGQLLITSFYAFENLNGAGLERFFDTASSVGIGGLVFKPERLLSEAPQRVIALCNEHALPLIQVPAETKYDALLLDVLGHFLDSNIVLLNRFFDLHRQMMALALQQPTVLQIIMNLRGALHADITFFDSTKDRRTTTSQELSVFSTPRLTELPGDQYRTHRYFDAQLSYPSITRHATAVLIPSSDDQIYYLILHVKSERLTPYDIMAVENVVSLLQMEILKQNALDRKLFFQNNNLVRDLLTDSTLDSTRIAVDLQKLGIDQHPLFQVLLLNVKLDDPSEVDRRADVLLMARRRLKMLFPTTAYLETSDSIVFLHNFKNASQSYTSNTIRSIMNEVASIPAMPGFTYIAALSTTAGSNQLPTLFRQAEETARFFDTGRYSNRCLRYEDLGVYKLFLQVADADELRGFIDPRVVALHDENPTFFETAAVLCDNNLNYQEAARQLYVHPKTMRYRAERIKKISGLDFHNPDDRLQISLGARIYQLLEPHS